VGKGVFQKFLEPGEPEEPDDRFLERDVIYEEWREECPAVENACFRPLPAALGWALALFIKESGSRSLT
jgi:hypothetical protein